MPPGSAGDFWGLASRRWRHNQGGVGLLTVAEDSFEPAGRGSVLHNCNAEVGERMLPHLAQSPHSEKQRRVGCLDQTCGRQEIAGY